jgi:DNA polymerase
MVDFYKIRLLPSKSLQLKNMPKQSATDLLAEISKLLQYHDALGIREYPRTQLLDRFLHKQDRPSPAQPGGGSQAGAKKELKTLEKKHVFDPGLAKRVTLQDVRQELGDCQRCRLHESRTNIVFGQGPAKTKLVIVADAPCREDDLQTAPVQGEAGALLDKMLAAIGLSREEVYITNLVKCFPGIDAKPAENEIKTCLPFLFRQIEIICPSVICTMGMQASQTLLHSRRSLFQLRGRFYNFNDLCSSKLQDRIVVMPSLHPSILLENSELKKASWQDLQMIQKKLQEG